MLKPNEILWNGYRVTARQAATYNALQARIESFRAAGRTVPAELLNGSHNLFKSFMQEN